jgi:exosome complex component MTR3
MEEGTLQCEVRYVPNVGFPMTALVGASASQLSDSSQQPTQISTGRMNNRISGQEKELSSQLLASLSAAVPLQAYPKNLLFLKLTVLQDDGSVLSACITAASLALVDASIEVYDIVTSSSVAVVTNNISGPPLLLADPTYEEMAQADAVVTLSLLANWKEVTLWNQSGRLSSEVANQAIGLCRDGCRTMHKFMRNTLLDGEDKMEE